jgi:hypothetical protein
MTQTERLKALSAREFMPVEAFEGATGLLVLRQEWPGLAGEAFSRLMMPMEQAEALARQILTLAQRQCQ